MEGDRPGPPGDEPGPPGDGPEAPGDGPEPVGRKKSRHYARIAERVDDWVQLDPGAMNFPIHGVSRWRCFTVVHYFRRPSGPLF